MILTKNHLEKLTKNRIYDLAEFIVSENFKHHTGTFSQADYQNDVNDVYKEEMNFFDDSYAYLANNFEAEIIGSIRALKWNYEDLLPIQKLFGVSPQVVAKMQSQSPIYHIGRFAIRKDVNDINLFKQLMICAIAPICNSKEGIAFAECDKKLLRILNLLGIQTTTLGESIFYLGSETIPISMTYNGLIKFFEKYKNSISLESISEVDSNNFSAVHRLTNQTAI